MIILEDIALRRGPKLLMQGASTTLQPGQKLALIGANGTGKSSLFAMLLGELSADQGQIRGMTGLRVAHMAQELEVSDDTTLNFVMAGDAAVYQLTQDIGKAEQTEDYERAAYLYQEMEVLDGYSAPRRAEQLLLGLGFTQTDLQTSVTEFSGGWRVRLNLARALMTPSDVLLLDEPTNHLDAESVAWLERFLESFSGTVVAITHDRYFLDNAAGWILELDRGRGIPYEGNYSTWLEAKETRLEQEQRTEAAHQKAIKAELEWVRSNPKGRQAKSKARLARFEELNSQEFQTRNETNEIYIPPGPRLGDKVIEVKNLRKTFGDRLLFDDVSFTVPTGSIVGIIGANGMGKSTLFKLLMGIEAPDGGEVELGETVQLSYVDQSRDDLDGSKTVWEEISDGLDIMRIGNYEVPSRSYVGRFNFKGTDQQKFVKDLSGGERNRLHLAKLLKQGGNVLLLDEPTNDLDIETLRALEEAILAFPGSALVISHDRWFLDRIATHILAYEDDGSVAFHQGNFTEYEEDRVARLGKDADMPSRVKHRKLMG